MVKYFLIQQFESQQIGIKRENRPKQVDPKAMILDFSKNFKSRFHQGLRESEPVLKSLRLTTIAASSKSIKKGEGGRHKFRQ